MKRTAIVARTLMAGLMLALSPTMSVASDSDRPRPVFPQETPAAKKPEPAPVKKAKPARVSKPVARPAAKRGAKPAKATTRRTARPAETAPSGVPPQGETRFLADEVIVRFSLSARQADMDALVARLGLSHQEGRTFVLSNRTLHRYSVTRGQDIATLISALEADPVVVYAQPNYLYRLQQAAKPAAVPQYALSRLGLSSETNRGKGVRIAIIDTPVDVAHPMLEGASLVSVAVAEQGKAPLLDHGTGIAVIMAARQTLAGIAGEADFVSIGVFHRGPDGNPASTSWLIGKGLDAAYGEKADIFNMSFAGPKDPLVADSISGAAGRNIICIGAAGNDGPDAAPLYPAAYDDVIGVTAIDERDRIYDRANRGDQVEYAAPGVSVLTLAPGQGVVHSTGTSFATAHVTGLAALVLNAAPGTTQEQLRSILDGASADLGEPGRDPVYGRGVPDAARALSSLGAPK